MNAYDLYTFYIEAADLKGQAHKVKVERVEVRDVFNPGTKKPEKKIVLHLIGKKKVLSLNKTRTGQMIALTGTPEIEQWAGAEIVIEAGKQSGKDTIVIKAPAMQAPPKPGPVNQPARAEGQTRLDDLKDKAQTDIITAYSEIWRAAGLDNQTAQAILKECAGDFQLAFDKIAEQYEMVLT